MELYEEENDNLSEAETGETPGVMVLGFFSGLGLAFLGLLCVFTGTGALVGIGLIVVGGLVCLISGLIGGLVEWRSRRHKEP